MENLWNGNDRDKQKHAKKNLSQCYFVYHKSHSDWPPDRTQASAMSGRRLTALKTKIRLNYIEGFRSNRAVNTLRLGYKNQ
jgi:hypothetical protein